MLTKEEFEKGLLTGTYSISGWSWKEENNPYEIPPETFLDYAKKDLSAGKDEQHLVNALSNVKRAIHCQMDLVIYHRGYYKRAKKENWNFPKKIEFIQKEDIIAPKILNNRNSAV